MGRCALGKNVWNRNLPLRPKADLLYLILRNSLIRRGNKQVCSSIIKIARSEWSTLPHRIIRIENGNRMPLQKFCSEDGLLSRYSSNTDSTFPYCLHLCFRKIYLCYIYWLYHKKLLKFKYKSKINKNLIFDLIFVLLSYLYNWHLTKIKFIKNQYRPLWIFWEW